MKCTYGLSARLPSFCYRKYFSCSYMCFNKNVVDVCEQDSFEDSLLIETVQEKLIETAISISSLSEQIMNVLENSHLEDTISLTKSKKKKMKRRKKRKQRTKCDIIKEDEIHPSPNSSVYENKLWSDISDWDINIPNHSQQCYDNTSFSHITSEKESGYSDDRLHKRVVVRKRKKLQRRRKRRAKSKSTGRNSINASSIENICAGMHHQNSCIYEKKDDEESCDKDYLGTPTGLVRDDTFNNAAHGNGIIDYEQSNEYKPVTPHNKNNQKLSKELPDDQDKKIVGVVTTVIAKDAKIVGTGSANINDELNIRYGQMKIIDSSASNQVLKNDSNMKSSFSNSRKVIDDDKFSKEQRRQLRRKMRNVKKRPESYVVLGLI